jgi:plasmid stabilization system protein ParE
MAYIVKLTSRAEEDAYVAFDYIWKESSLLHADRWLEGLFTAAFSLRQHPHRCPPIPEADEIGREIRHLLYGRRSTQYRIIFDVQEQSADGPLVRILHIRRSSRDRLTPEDLDSVH